MSKWYKMSLDDYFYFICIHSAHLWLFRLFFLCRIFIFRHWLPPRRMTSVDPRLSDVEDSEKYASSAAAQNPMQRIGIISTISSASSALDIAPTKKRKRSSSVRSSSTQESPRQSRKKRAISTDKSKASKHTARNTTNSSSIRHQDSISSAKGLSPFWSKSKQELSPTLWLPTVTGSPASVSTYLNVRSENIKSHSTWFQTKIQSIPETPNKSWLKISSPFVTTLWPKTTEGVPLPSLKIGSDLSHLKQAPESRIRAIKLKLRTRLHSDRHRLTDVFGIVRWTYNQTVALLKDPALPSKRLQMIDTASNKPVTLLKYLRSEIVNNESALVLANPWLKNVGYDIRDAALNDAYTAYCTGVKKVANGTFRKFTLRFRSRKKTPTESLYLRSRWIVLRNDKKNRLDIKWPNQKTPMSLFLSNRANQQIVIEKDCRLQRTNQNTFYLCVPMTYPEPSARVVENQDHANHSTDGLRVCSIDPGVRTFQTIYDVTRGRLIDVAPRDIGKIIRLSCNVDKLISQKTHQLQRSTSRYQLNRAIKRARERIRCLIDEVHKQLAKFLVTEFDLILLPEFETSRMIRKLDRKIHSKSARSMASWAHYRFRQRVIFKAMQFGAKVALVDESYTSKTCSSCGNIKHDLHAAKIYHCTKCGSCVDRDANGAKNIFLKNYEALGITFPSYGA